jgi:hypothetical protein
MIEVTEALTMSLAAKREYFAKIHGRSGPVSTCAVSKLERAKGFEPSAHNSQPPQSQVPPESTEAGHTQIRAQILDSSSPDLAKVVAAWSKLSAPLKAAILAIVATSKDQKEEALS